MSSQQPPIQAPSESTQPSASASDADRAERRLLRRDTLLAATGGLALALVLWGGYSHNWPWTGINGGTATMWDWLHLLLLPLVFSILPIWFRLDTKVHRRTKVYFLVGVGVFAVLVILGYAIPWKWTGFRGNTLWDWLGLIALPVTLMLMPRFRELRGRWQPRHTAALGTFFTVFVALVLAGYLAKWTWTGFTGNKLWNWMHLLLLPLLLPTVILPALRPRAMGHVVRLDRQGNVILDQHGNPVRHGQPLPPRPPANQASPPPASPAPSGPPT
jgi:hypothetical protein